MLARIQWDLNKKFPIITIVMPKIKLNRIELYYEKHGNGEEAVIVLHGFPSS